MSIYERIEKLRKLANLSQGKLEKELGFSNGSISKWRNSTPTPERLQKIADYFGVSVDYLMTGEEKENKMPIFEYSSDIMELIKLYSQLNKEQKSAILNMMRSFALTNQ